MGTFKITVLLLLLLPAMAAIALPDQKVIDSLRKELKASHDDFKTVDIKTALAKKLRNQAPAEALQEAREALGLAGKINYTKGAAASNDIIGSIYLNKSDYKTALYHHFVALRLFTKLNDQKGQAFVTNNIGSVYFQLKRYADARQFYEKSLDLKLKLGLFKESNSTYINIGNLLLKEKKYAECLEYYNKAYVIAKRYQIDYNASIALMNMGEAYIELKNYPTALKYYNQALELNTRRNDNHHITTCYLGLGMISLNTGALVQAGKQLNTAEKLAKSIDSKDLLASIYKSYSELFEKKGDHAASLKYYKAYHALNDSLFNSENIQQIAELQSKFDLENKEEEIAELSKGRELTQALMFKEKILRNYLTISALLLLFIAIILGRNIVLSSRVNKILVEKNAEIETHQKQIEQQNQTLSDFNKELMKENISAKYEILKAKINPHFLFNSLSTLSNLIVKNQDEASDFVRRFSKLYRRILELGNIQLITIEEELDFVSEFLFLQKIRFKDNLIYSFNVHKIHQRNYIPPFSIQLLVENAIKHNTISNENKLIIKVFSENECIIVSNNLQKKEFPEESTKVGQKNIYDRYKFISRQEPEFTEDETRYIVSLPIIKDALI